MVYCIVFRYNIYVHEKGLSGTEEENNITRKILVPDCHGTSNCGNRCFRGGQYSW